MYVTSGGPAGYLSPDTEQQKGIFIICPFLALTPQQLI